jgi:hypothetical protein
LTTVALEHGGEVSTHGVADRRLVQERGGKHLAHDHGADVVVRQLLRQMESQRVCEPLVIEHGCVNEACDRGLRTRDAQRFFAHL